MAMVDPLSNQRVYVDESGRAGADGIPPCYTLSLVLFAIVYSSSPIIRQGVNGAAFFYSTFARFLSLYAACLSALVL